MQSVSYPSHFLFFICSEQIPETTGAPLELVTSEVTARTFRVSWSHAPGNVEKYRVVYYPASGGEPQEVHTVFYFNKDTQIYTSSKLTQFKLGAHGVSNHYKQIYD